MANLQDSFDFHQTIRNDIDASVDLNYVMHFFHIDAKFSS